MVVARGCRVNAHGIPHVVDPCVDVLPDRLLRVGGGVSFGSFVGSVARPVHEHQRNAKLQLTVVLAPPEVVPGLYVHPDHRRRRRRPVVRSQLDV